MNHLCYSLGFVVERKPYTKNALQHLQYVKDEEYY